MLILFFTYDLFFFLLIINNLGKGKIVGCKMEESFFISINFENFSCLFSFFRICTALKEVRCEQCSLRGVNVVW